MIIDRRNFVRAAGLGALAAASTPAKKLLAQDQHAMSGMEAAPGKALTAKRWAMVVDTRKATPANVHKAIKACHTEHNVPDLGNPKDEIKWIWEEHFSHAFHEQDLHHLPDEVKHVPTLLLCNHCDKAPCVQVCPTEATWKRESDGIVMMDWHRCVGCRYCVVACPYGSRSFNFRDPRPHIEHINTNYPTRMRGVVEKCTFCASRLEKGLLPSCVEATQESGMMVFGDLEDPNSNVSKLLRKHFTIRRKPGLGTQPEVYYIVPETGAGDEHADATPEAGGMSHD
jgi:[DsrC]-trisulfide reductase subunit O